MLPSHSRLNGSLPIPCMGCLKHRCSVSLVLPSLLVPPPLCSLPFSPLSCLWCCPFFFSASAAPASTSPPFPLLDLFFLPLPCSTQFGRMGALGCGGSAPGLTLTTGIGSLTRGPPQSLVRVGLAAVEPLLASPPPLLLFSAGWVFSFPLALLLIHTAQLGRLGGSRFWLGSSNKIPCQYSLSLFLHRRFMIVHSPPSATLPAIFLEASCCCSCWCSRRTFCVRLLLALYCQRRWGP